MKVKTTAAGSPVDDLDLLMGDPFAPKGERYHDRPDLNAVNKDIAQMDGQFRDLHLDVGVGPVRLEGHAADDLRHNLERQYRDRIVVGAYENPEQMFADGAPMPQTMENAVRYSGGETREAAGQVQQWADGMLAEYAQRYPDVAGDTAGLHSAVTRVMNELRDHYRENPVEFAHNNRREFLDRVYYAHLHAQSYSDDDSGRTGGITIGAPAARGNAEEPKGDMVEDLRALQRARGW
jgi:hypothetical protein